MSTETPPPAAPKSKRNLVIAVIVAVVVGGLGGSYAYANGTVSSALDRVFDESCVGTPELLSFSALPLNIKYRIPLVIRNPTDISITMDRVAIEVFLDSAKIGGIDETGKFLAPRGRTSLDMNLELGTNLAPVVQAALEGQELTIQMSGGMTLSGTALFFKISKDIPVEVSSSLSEAAAATGTIGQC